MADFTQTITNEFQLFGPAPPNVWGTMEWGENWGDGNDVITSTHHFLDSQDVTLTDSYIREFVFTIDFGSTSITSAMDQMTLVDSEGFYHIFRGNTTEAEERAITDYTEESSSDPGWSEVSSPSTSWS